MGGLADHWSGCSFHHRRVPLLLLLLLRNPGLPLLLLQGAVGRLNKLNIGAGTPGYSPGTRATPPLELAKPSFPPSRLSGTHLNIGKTLVPLPESTDLQEKSIERS